MLNKLKGILNSPSYWETFYHPFASKTTTKYYLNRFICRVELLIKERGISRSDVDSFVREMSLRKFRIACKMYYNTESYSEKDIEDEGEHLMAISHAYACISEMLGIPTQRLIDIRLSEDIKATNCLFEWVDTCEYFDTQSR